jgi:hypothetical protein
MPRDSGRLTDSAAEDDTTPAATLLLLLVAADITFIALHLVNVETGWFHGVPLSLEADGGLPETYQYIKIFWIVLCLASTFWRTRVRLYGYWALVFAFLLVDDAGQIHERVGAWLGRSYAVPVAFGLRPNDIGELTFAVVVGLAMLALVGFASWRVGEQARRVSRDILCLVLVLAFIGVPVDTLHVIAYFQRSLLAQVLLVVEDGGEMLVMSALMAYAFHLASHRGHTRFDLWASVKTRLGAVRTARPSEKTPAQVEAARRTP